LFSVPQHVHTATQVKRYLHDKGVRYKDVDVSRDTVAARDMMRRSGQMGVPVVDIGGKIVIGFDRLKIDRYLGITK